MSFELNVGFARENITPKEPVPLGGYGNAAKRMSEETVDNFYVSCYALTDSSSTTVMLINCDLIQAPTFLVDFAKDEICRQYGIKKENIFLAGTHTHSSPEIRSFDAPYIPEYNEKVKSAILLCAKNALDDRKPSKLYTGEAKSDRLNFVRHYKASPPGEEPFYFGDNKNDHLLRPGITQNYGSHLSEPDNRMHILKIERTGGKDLIIANWRAHATLTGGFDKRVASADFPGELRRITEERVDCFFTYFQGAAGNINPYSRIKAECRTRDCTEFSQLLSEVVTDALLNIKPMEIAPIKVLAKVIDVDVNHSLDDRIDDAREVRKFFLESGDRKKANEFALSKGFYSAYHASAVVRRYKEPKTAQLPLTVFSVGNLGFIAVPNEMFDKTAVNIENRSDFDALFTFCYCNGALSYLPTKETYEHGYYEAYNSKYSPGTAEKVEDTFVAMLEEI